MITSDSVPFSLETRNKYISRKKDKTTSPYFTDFMNLASLTFQRKMWLNNNGSYIGNNFSSMVWMFQSNGFETLKGNIFSRLCPYQLFRGEYTKKMWWSVRFLCSPPGCSFIQWSRKNSRGSPFVNCRQSVEVFSFFQVNRDILH